nr:MAG TPA: hypothetical protein [Caudoviricetes sp.]
MNQLLNLLSEGSAKYTVAAVSKNPTKVPEIPAKLLAFELLVKNFSMKQNFISQKITTIIGDKTET